ncbi:DMT family transporter [Streptomyces javensis]|uniref:DMT family transporter n=1 Tax=Streptomyces javensis TaxID=114698 RepID=UPI0033ED753E
MGELLAVASALCFGTTHFLSGLVSRHRHGVTVAACAQAGGTVVSLVPVLLTQGADAPPSALGWGALSGLGTGVGVACLYWSMNQGPMSVVVPVSDVTAVGLPVLAGIALLGDRPSPPALTGIALGLPALWLVSRGEPGGPSGPREPRERRERRGRCESREPRGPSERCGSRWRRRSRGWRGPCESHELRGRRGPFESHELVEPHEPSGPRAPRSGHGPGADRPRPAVVLALVAGVGLALHFFALARIPASAGWWPVVVSRAVSVAVILALFPATGASWRLPRRAAAVSVVAGALGTLATILYLLATRQELLSVAVVLSALYPAVPVLLALTFLRERITRPQAVGLLGAGLAIGLIALN